MRTRPFRWRERAYAIQFHLEVSTRMACDWAAVPSYAQALEQTLGPGAFDALLAQLQEGAQELNAAGRRPVLTVARSRCRAGRRC